MGSKGAPMREAGRTIDRVAGRIYTRVLAMVTGTISVAMLVAALLALRGSGVAGCLIWGAGALVFGLIARSSWRSRAGMSDIDFTG